MCACFMESSGDEARSDHTFNHAPVSPRSSESAAETRCCVVRREQTRTAAELSRHRVSPELTANHFSTTSCVVTKTADKCRFRPLRKQPSFCSDGCFSQTPRTSVAPPQKARAAAPRPRRTSQTRESSSRNFCPISMLSLCLCCSLAHSFSIGIHTEPDTSDRG